MAAGLSPVKGANAAEGDSGHLCSQVVFPGCRGPSACGVSACPAGQRQGVPAGTRGGFPGLVGV